MMKDWLEHEAEFSGLLLDHEAPPSDLCCASCQELLSESSYYRCLDCHSNTIYCKSCCIKDHARHPFHKIERWTGQHFTSSSLSEIGFILCVGHEGRGCERGTESELTIVDKEGIFIHKVRWCGCSSPKPKYQQLLEVGLYPASIRRPKTAFTFKLLKYFHLDAMECRTAASNFYNKLRRMTNEADPESVPVSNILAL